MNPSIRRQLLWAVDDDARLDPEIFSSILTHEGVGDLTPDEQDELQRQTIAEAVEIADLNLRIEALLHRCEIEGRRIDDLKGQMDEGEEWRN